MGCHTWFYEKNPIQYTYEEAKDGYLSFLDKEIAFLELEKKYYSQVELQKRVYNVVKKSLCKVATLHRFAIEVMDLNYCRRNNTFYKDCDKYHDLFRFYGYPPNELLSFEETVLFMEKDERACPSLNTENDFRKIRLELKKFWNENPEGMIAFG